MKIKFTFLSLEEPWTGGKANLTYYKFNALMDSGVGQPKFCLIETSDKGYSDLKSAKPGAVIEGNFDIKPSFERKAPVLVFSGL